MEDSNTSPTLEATFEYKGTPFLEAKSAVLESTKKRCFTPTTNDFLSPGLSPIILQELSNNNNNNNKNEATTLPIIILTTDTGKHYKFLPESDVKVSNDSKVSNGHNKTTTNDSVCSVGLNHNLNVTMLLQNTGLEEYKERFEREQISLDKLLLMTSADLLAMGMTQQQQQLLSDALKEFNISTAGAQ